MVAYSALTVVFGVFMAFGSTGPWFAYYNSVVAKVFWGAAACSIWTCLTVHSVNHFPGRAPGVPDCGENRLSMNTDRYSHPAVAVNRLIMVR